MSVSTKDNNIHKARSGTTAATTLVSVRMLCKASTDVTTGKRNLDFFFFL